MFKILGGMCSAAQILALLVWCQFTFLISSGHAQVGGLALNLDAAQFMDDQQKSYLEIYYSFPETDAKFVQNNEDGYSCQIGMAVQIYQNQMLWASKGWKIERTVEDTLQMDDQKHLVDMLRYTLEEPGTYRIVVSTQDLNDSGQIDSTDAVIEVRSFSQEKLEVSDLEFASRIKRAKPGNASIFVKNTYEIVPNPAALYGESSPEVYFYFEVYNLMTNVTGNKFKVLCYVQDSAGREIKGLGSRYRTKKKVFDFDVEMGMKNVSNLSSGEYTLVYGIADSAGTVIESRKKEFFVYNPIAPAPGRIIDDTVMAENDYGPLEYLSEEDLDEEFSQLTYLTTRKERNFYKDLKGAEAKRKYIGSIWREKRPDEEIAELDYRQQYLTRVKEAEDLYQEMLRPGWKTDKGRVYVLYGSPHQVDRYPSTTTRVPYEIWTYESLKGQGGVIFVFANLSGFNRYELLHSTLRGELQEPNWEKMITRGSEEF